MLISDKLKDFVEVYITADGIDNESDHIPIECNFNSECVYVTEIETQHYSRDASYTAILVYIEQYK